MKHQDYKLENLMMNLQIILCHFMSETNIIHYIHQDSS